MIISSYGGFGLTAADFIIAMRSGGMVLTKTPIATSLDLTPIAITKTPPMTLTAMDTSTAPPAVTLDPLDPANLEQPVSLAKALTPPRCADPKLVLLDGKCVPDPHKQAYTDAMRAQADQVLDLSPSFFDRIPPAILWAGALGAVALVVYRSRRAAPMQGYRRRRRKK